MTTCCGHLVRRKSLCGLTLWNQWSSIAFPSPPTDMFLDTERQIGDIGLPCGLGSIRVTAEGAEPQNKGHQEEERVSLKTAGWVQTDVFVNMTIWTHLETTTPPTRWPLLGQVPPSHALPVILFSFLQSCAKAKSHQRSSQGSLSPSYLRMKLQIHFGNEAHPLGRPLPWQGKCCHRCLSWVALEENPSPQIHLLSWHITLAGIPPSELSSFAEKTVKPLSKCKRSQKGSWISVNLYFFSHKYFFSPTFETYYHLSAESLTHKRSPINIVSVCYLMNAQKWLNK